MITCNHHTRSSAVRPSVLQIIFTLFNYISRKKTYKIKKQCNSELSYYFTSSSAMHSSEYFHIVLHFTAYKRNSSRYEKCPWYFRTIQLYIISAITEFICTFRCSLFDLCCRDFNLEVLLLYSRQLSSL